MKTPFFKIKPEQDFIKILFISILGAFSAVIGIRIDNYSHNLKKDCVSEKSSNLYYYLNHHYLRYTGLFILTIFFTFIFYFILYLLFGKDYII